MPQFVDIDIAFYKAVPVNTNRLLRLCCPVRQLMLTRMTGVAQNLQVGDRIIKVIAVDMMNEELFRIATSIAHISCNQSQM